MVYLLALNTFVLAVFVVLSVHATIWNYRRTKSSIQAVKKSWLIYTLTALFLTLEIYAIIYVVKEKIFILIFLLGILTTVGYFFAGPIYAMFINYIKRKEIKDVPIYIRDVEVEYSPAVVSYLMNLKLEKNKDLIATILNICAKGALKLKKVNNQVVFEKTDNEVILTNDESYLYDYLIGKEDKFSYNKWKNKVKKEYDKCAFSKDESFASIMSMYAAVTFFAVAILGFISMALNIRVYGIDLIYLLVFYLMVTGFLNAFYIALIIVSASLKNKWFNEADKFRRIYTSKGVKEVMKWEKFKAFIIDFTIINKRELKEIVLFEKYLSYSMALNINKEYLSVDNDMIDNIISGNFYDSHIKELFSEGEK